MPAYFSSQIFALWLVVIASLLCSVKGDHVPGCGCDVSTCGYGSGARPSACGALNGFYNASSILDQVGSPICDTVDASDQFQDLYGRDRTIKYQTGKGELELYDQPLTPIRIGRGACESDALPEQESCNITSDWIFISGSQMVKSCANFRNPLNPVDNTTEFVLSAGCQAFFDDEPVYGKNIRLQAVPLGTSDDVNLCEKTEQAAQQTLLTSDDWITPQPGRR